jgi:hypothetical protein
MESFWGWVIVGVIGWLLYYCVQLLRRRFCDLCGRSAICHLVNGFSLCRKCSRVAALSTTPVADLIAARITSPNTKGVNSTGESSPAADPVANSIAPTRQGSGFGTGSGGGLLKLAMIAGLGMGLLWLGGFRYPPLPVVTAWRPSVVNDSRVLLLSNQTAHQLTVSVTVTREGEAESRPVAIPIPPNGNREIGWAEGCVFQKGDRITLSHPEHLSFSELVP